MLPGGPAERAEPATGVRRLFPRTLAGQVRAMTVLVVLALGAVLVTSWVAVDNARDGVRVIGHDAGPQVVATGDLYFQLTNMDAQLANALMVGRAQGLGVNRDAALQQYDDSRLKAGAALLQASKLADEPTEERTARATLDALARYERLAGQALLLDQNSAHAPGPPSDAVIEKYQAATDLMKLDLLPKAYNLTLDNGTLVRHTYENKHDAVLNGRIWVALTGLLLIVLLGGLQLYLAVRYRRLLNPLLALATLVTLVLTVMSWSMLSSQASHLSKAKHDGFDSILALSRARAIGNSANADQTRFLLDPKRADTYEQLFLDKSQSLLYLKADNLAQYSSGVQQGLEPGRKEILGFFGAEFGGTGLPGQRAALDKVLNDYRTFQRDDHAMRQLVASGRRSQAIAARTSTNGRDYATYDTSLGKLIAIHSDVFKDAVAKGDDGTKGWNLVIPGAGLVIVVLVLIGVRPRLAEYR
ncbi:hypothetical protein J4573_52005 [Actinomadura barringtoniae]|uniref:Secreted protein n=1 Tax=Actinomadura barringtoniae TaxID=1427535 RepID=A0A939PMT1_9ACTN|nr:hypothetical protein [Actinomadura barringtoniae]